MGKTAMTAGMRILQTWDEVKAKVKASGLIHLEHSVKQVERAPSDAVKLEHLHRIQIALLEKGFGFTADLVEKVLEGKLPEQAPTLENRLAEIKEDSARIGRPVDWFIVTAPYETPISDLEREHSAKMIEGEVREGILHAMMSPIKTGDDIVLFVDVWNCQARLALEEPNRHRIIEIPGKLQKRFDRIVDRIIYQENQGAINMSGLYYPKTDASARILQQVYAHAQRMKQGQIDK